MLVGQTAKKNKAPTVLRRMRESAKISTRVAGGMIGVSHVTISQFENEKLDLPEYRLEQMVGAYGFTMEEFNKIIGRAPIISPIDDCHAMLNRMDEGQLLAVRGVMSQMLRIGSSKSEERNSNV